MTPEPADARFSGEEDLQALHRELQEPIVDVPEDETPTGAANPDQLVFALDHSMFSEMTRAFVDRLLSNGENPSPELRQRLTRAAARGLEYQRKHNGPLPILLAERREALHMEVPTLASTLGVSDDDVYNLESGKLEVRAVEPGMLVSWARALETPGSAVVPALRRTLELTRATAGPVAAGRREAAKLSDEDEKLIAEVSDLFQR